MSNRKRKRKEMVRYGFPASPPVVQYYTLRKAGSRPKQRSWNNHEAAQWQRLWRQRCSRETVVLSFIRWKVRMTDRSNPLFDQYLLLFSLSARLRLELLSCSTFIFCLVFSAPTLSTLYRYSPSVQIWTLLSQSLSPSNASPPFSGDLSSIRKKVGLWTENGAVGGWGTT